MNHKKKSKKNMHLKNKRKKHNATIKIIGGDVNNLQHPSNIGNASNNITNETNANEIMNEVENEREFSLGKSILIQKASILAEGIAIKTIEAIGNLLGIDLSDTQDISGNLDRIKVALSNPENREKIREIIGQVSEILAVALEAASPFIQPLLDKTFDVGTNALSKMGESAVKIGLNTAEEIPGVGVLIGTIRSLSNAMEAFLSTANAGEEIFTSASDSVNAAVKNFKQISKEKEASLNRIQNSVNSFQTPTLFNSQYRIPQVQIPQVQMPQMPQVPQMPQMPSYRGGKMHDNKRKKYKIIA